MERARVRTLYTLDVKPRAPNQIVEIIFLKRASIGKFLPVLNLELYAWN